MSRRLLNHKTGAPKFARKLAATSSLAAGAGLGLLAEAQAGVIQFVPPGGPVTIVNGGGYYQFDIDGDLAYDFVLYDSYFGNFRLVDRYQFFSGYLGTNLIKNADTFAAAVVPSGDLVGPDSSGWLNSASLTSFDGIRGYAGVEFDIPGGSPHFAFLDVSMDSNSITLHGGAYESLANTPIAAGVPEPASLALLASGAVGLAAWRRRRAS